MTANRVQVAAAVICKPDGRFLLAQRPVGKVYAGYWEFPGGKIENGDSPRAALARELHEELGIEVEQAYPWITRDYDYAHAAVRLRFFRVTGWRGDPHGKEAQAFSWQTVTNLSVSPLLPANGPVLRALKLPAVYGITHAAAAPAPFLKRLEAALEAGLRLFQIREKEASDRELREFARLAVAAARRHGARVLVNGNARLAEELGADGVHLTSAQLREQHTRPSFELVGASCHDAAELAQAARIGADFVVLGPVLATPSHPERAGMGWQRFAALVQDYPVPVYALGGMRSSHLTQAWAAGAHGIAMMRGAWGASTAPGAG
jgi:8-oxo-dGTP diphosphatase